jgi:hypothetical protein
MRTTASLYVDAVKEPRARPCAVTPSIEAFGVSETPELARMRFQRPSAAVRRRLRGYWPSRDVRKVGLPGVARGWSGVH